jgi:hypothetical protein
MTQGDDPYLGNAIVCNRKILARPGHRGNRWHFLEIMKYYIEILTEGEFTKDMYCRPLHVTFPSAQSDTFMETSTYGESPINNYKWLPITYFLGEHWFRNHRTIKDFEASPSATKMEWARGTVPSTHILIPEGSPLP